jgi:hypothetical protein
MQVWPLLELLGKKTKPQCEKLSTTTAKLEKLEVSTLDSAALEAFWAGYCTQHNQKKESLSSWTGQLLII